jgi:2-haloalkanoic acid dehalogenase type II
MSVKAVTFDAYGTLLRNEDLRLVPSRIVADHGLSVSVDEVYRLWAEGYYRETQVAPFRTLREIEAHTLGQLLKQFGIGTDAARYVDLFFAMTTKVELYPETLAVLGALADVRSAVVSNADHEHVAAWRFTLPVEFIQISEAVRAYKPHPQAFRRALERLRLEPHDVLHVGDSDVDDVSGAKAAGMKVVWVNRDRRPRRADVPPPDFEIADLTELPPLLERTTRVR